jgi:hypothetical protein
LVDQRVVDVLQRCQRHEHRFVEARRSLGLGALAHREQAHAVDEALHHEAHGPHAFETGITRP